MPGRAPAASAGESTSYPDIGLRRQPDRGGSSEPGLRGGSTTCCVDPVRPDVSRGCWSPGDPGLMRQILGLGTVELARRGGCAVSTSRALGRPIHRALGLESRAARAAARVGVRVNVALAGGFGPEGDAQALQRRVDRFGL